MFDSFSWQCDSYRKYYKHILKGEKMIDDLKKQTETQGSKTTKLQKQVIYICMYGVTARLIISAKWKC